MLATIMGETVKDKPEERIKAASAPSPALVVVYSGNEPCFHVFPLRNGKLALGRDELAACHIADERASRRHLAVAYTNATWTVSDEGSTNGTFLDGVPLTGTRSLAAPRVIRIGRTIILPILDGNVFALHGLSTQGDRIIGPTLRAIHQQIERVARAGQNLLITGPSGAGKELAARVFHEASGQRRSSETSPFVALNCATLQRELAERILFGARRGAYSGAVADADGLVQAAASGTLFLDEIAELDLTVQPKLLRVLETKEVTPLGAVRATRVDFNLCVATLKDLRGEVDAGRFREDLYFRIGRPEITLPSLAERPEEIPWLVHRAVASISSPGSPRVASAELVEACLLRPWPGNVRELLAEVRFAALAAPPNAPILGTDLAPAKGRALATEAMASNIDLVLDPMEVALQEEGGNVARAAARVGVARSKLRRFIERTGLDVDRFRKK